MTNLRPCGGCGQSVVPLRIEAKPPHFAKEVCPHCNQFMGFAKKPENEKKRSSTHRELVAKYSKGFCEMCLVPSEELGTGNYLVGHHVKEHSDGGTSDRENVWILCNACHSLVHWTRTHHGRNTVAVEVSRES